MVDTIPIDGKIRPIQDRLYVKDIEKGENITKSGLIILDDNMSERGVRPRWATVYKTGPKVDGLNPGDRILIAHARWTKPFIALDDNGEYVELRAAEYPDSILLVMEKGTWEEESATPKSSSTIPETKKRTLVASSKETQRKNALKKMKIIV